MPHETNPLVPDDSRRQGQRPTILLVLTPSAMKALAEALTAAGPSAAAKTPGWWSLMTDETSRN